MSENGSDGGGDSVGEKSRYDAGAPTLESVAQFGEAIEKSKKSPYMIVDPVFVAAQQGVVNDEQAKARMRALNAGKFPIRPLPADPYDTTWQIKQDLFSAVPPVQVGGQPVQPLGNNQPMVNERRPLPWTKADIEYLQRKRDAEENAAYLFWQASKYNLNDPATRDWFSRVCPSYFDQRSSLIEEQIDASARYAKIRLRGPKTEDDYKFQWMIETDRLQLPKGPLWDPYQWMLNEADVAPNATAQQVQQGILDYNQQQYRRGIWNPIKVMNPQGGARVPNVYNRSDPTGIPGSRFMGPIGAPVPTDTTGNYAAAYGGQGLLGARNVINATNAGQQIGLFNYNRQQLALTSNIPPANVLLQAYPQNNP